MALQATAPSQAAHPADSTVSGVAPPAALRVPLLYDRPVDPYIETGWTPHVCRVINFTVALLGLIVFLPAMMLIAAVIRLTSAGPVFFRQTRIGIDRRHPHQVNGHWRRRRDYGGKPFTMYKFRTMVDDAGAKAQVWASPDDPRVTAVGRILRLHRLDELPQLFNVLKGEMNIVGPRPEQPKIFEQLRDSVHQYPIRQRVPPGITGWAQINHRYDRDISDVQAKLALDLEYIRSRHPVRDLTIMVRTVPVMLTGKGAW